MNDNDVQQEPAEERVPSLLDNEARGGDNSEKGLSFQASVLLSYIPRWLAIEGFTSLLREGLGDAEARFFVPGQGYKKEFVEVKDHSLAPSEFWPEIKRFQVMDAGSPGEYLWFTLSCTGVSKELQPVINSLRRIRGPHGFYEAGSALVEQSYKDYVACVEKVGHTPEEAEFLYKRVLIDADLSTNRTHAVEMFSGALLNNHPAYGEMPARLPHEIYAELGTFVQSRRTQLITRIELEGALCRRVPESLRPAVSPVAIFTGSKEVEDRQERTELYFPWSPFSGGDNREYPQPDAWDDQLLRPLLQTRVWILSHRATRRVRLTGQRRISASLALGSVFSAVAGFSIEMVGREEVLWATDMHPDSNTPAYDLSTVESSLGRAGDRVAVSVGIMRDMATEVDKYLAEVGLSDAPRIHLKGDAPIVSPQQANLSVEKIKKAILAAIATTNARQVDLFFAGPSQLALFLGHRLNATASVQCYERIGPSQYTPTCRLSVG